MILSYLSSNIKFKNYDVGILLFSIQIDNLFKV